MSKLSLKLGLGFGLMVAVPAAVVESALRAVQTSVPGFWLLTLVTVLAVFALCWCWNRKRAHT